MATQRRFQHPSDHATSLVATATRDPATFAHHQYRQAVAAKDQAGAEQWICVLAILAERGLGVKLKYTV